VKDYKALGAALVDIVAITALCILAGLKVISGEAVVPVVILIAGASVGTNMQRVQQDRISSGRSMFPPPPSGAPPSPGTGPNAGPTGSGPGGAAVVGLVSGILQMLRGMGK